MGPSDVAVDHDTTYRPRGLDEVSEPSGQLHVIAVQSVLDVLMQEQVVAGRCFGQDRLRRSLLSMVDHWRALNVLGFRIRPTCRFNLDTPNGLLWTPLDVHVTGRAGRDEGVGVKVGGIWNQTKMPIFSS